MATNLPAQNRTEAQQMEGESCVEHVELSDFVRDPAPVLQRSLASLSPARLWAMAEERHPDDKTQRALLYVELMRKAGHIVPGKPRPLPCGWDPKKSLEENLMTDEERKKLHADLAEMARLRRRAEAEAANIVLP